MRLIDVDKLIEELKSSQYYIAGLRCNKSILGQTMTQYAKMINKTIKEQPTAFDVDRVVEQLEDEKMWYETHGVNMDMKKGIIGATCKAIKIVRGGGIDDN